jgi:hypothetical protein
MSLNVLYSNIYSVCAVGALAGAKLAQLAGAEGYQGGVSGKDTILLRKLVIKLRLSSYE